MKNQTASEILKEYSQKYNDVANAYMQAKDRQPWLDGSKYVITLYRLKVLIEFWYSLCSERSQLDETDN